MSRESRVTRRPQVSHASDRTTIHTLAVDLVDQMIAVTYLVGDFQHITYC
jgi:hypothetical protein